MLKNYKPTTPSTRQLVSLDNALLSKEIFYPQLVKGFPRSFGKNNQGRITVRHRGGGHKRLYRKIEFNRNEAVFGEVKNIEYDPNRTANIAAIAGENGKCYYILAPEKLEVGTYIYSGPNAPILPGNALPIGNIPVGSLIHNISLNPNEKAKYVRSAGTSAQLLQKYPDGKGKIRLSSGQYILASLKAYATIGIVSNSDFKNCNLGKAGRKRWLNRRPKVRGVAKNPVDHPHGGGEGKTSGGRPSVSFSGRITKGQPTVKNRKKYNLKNR